MEIFLPKLFVESIYAIDLDLLKEHNIKGLILDVDNTLVAQYVEKPDDRLIVWIDNLRENNIKMCIVSNGAPERVNKFNEDLNLYVISKARKPSKKGFLKALEIMDLSTNEVAVVGDQLFTDMLGGNRLNMFTILVKMIDKKEELFVHLKRYLEKAVLILAKRI